MIVVYLFVCIGLSFTACKSPNDLDGPSVISGNGNDPGNLPLLSLDALWNQNIGGVSFNTLTNPHSVSFLNPQISGNNFEGSPNARIGFTVSRSAMSIIPPFATDSIPTLNGIQASCGTYAGYKITQVSMNLAERTHVLKHNQMVIGNDNPPDFQLTTHSWYDSKLELPNVNLAANVYTENYTLEDNVIDLPPVLETQSPKAGQTIRRADGVTIILQKPIEYTNSTSYGTTVEARLTDEEGYKTLRDQLKTGITNLNSNRFKGMIVAKSIPSGATSARFTPKDLEQLFAGQKNYLILVVKKAKTTNNKTVALMSYSERIIEIKLVD